MEAVFWAFIDELPLIFIASFWGWHLGKIRKQLDRIETLLDVNFQYVRGIARQVENLKRVQQGKGEKIHHD